MKIVLLRERIHLFLVSKYYKELNAFYQLLAVSEGIKGKKVGLSIQPAIYLPATLCNHSQKVTSSPTQVNQKGEVSQLSEGLL